MPKKNPRRVYKSPKVLEWQQKFATAARICAIQTGFKKCMQDTLKEIKAGRIPVVTQEQTPAPVAVPG